MSMSNEEHVHSRQIITFGPQPEDKRKKCESFFINKKVNGWNLMLDVDEYGKVTMSGSKILGKLSATGDEAKINITIESTQNRSPALKKVGYGSSYETKFIEVNDELSRVTR